jgi:hypothetical protein
MSRKKMTKSNSDSRPYQKDEALRLLDGSRSLAGRFHVHSGPGAVLPTLAQIFRPNIFGIVREKSGAFLAVTFYWYVMETGVVSVRRREYWMIYRGPGFRAVVWFGSSPHPSCQQVVALYYYSCVSLVKFTDGWGGGGAKSYDGEKTWSLINN